MEALRFLGVWKLGVSPLVLILLMQFRAEGIMGNKEDGEHPGRFGKGTVRTK